MNKVYFTNREKDILALKMLGYGDKEVAEQLSISYSTVRTHLERAKFKSGCKNIIQLLVQARPLLKN